MKLPTPQQFASKWQQRTAGSTQALTDGINAVTESPTAKAAAAADKYVAGVQAAVADGRWQAGLNAVSLTDWKNAMIQKGVGRVSQGTQAAIPKMQAFAAAFFPVLAQNVAQVNAMPSNTLEDRINKMVQMARLNSQFTFKKS